MGSSAIRAILSYYISLRRRYEFELIRPSVRVYIVVFRRRKKILLNFFVIYIWHHHGDDIAVNKNCTITAGGENVVLFHHYIGPEKHCKYPLER